MAGAGGTPFGYGTWDEFVIAFKKSFAPTNSQGEAMAALLNLSQGRRTLVEYTAEFTQLALCTKVTDDINRCNYYLIGLDYDLREKLFATGQVVFDHFDGLIDNANEIDNNNCRLAAIKQSHRRGNFQTQNNSSYCPCYVPSTSQKDPNAMDVDRSNFTCLTPKEKAKLIKSGGCFYCHKDGHQFKNCPTKPARNAHQTSIPEETGASIAELSDEEDISACRMDF
jgi:hypothetical protein